MINIRACHIQYINAIKAGDCTTETMARRTGRSRANAACVMADLKRLGLVTSRKIGGISSRNTHSYSLTGEEYQVVARTHAKGKKNPYDWAACDMVIGFEA